MEVSHTLCLAVLATGSNTVQLPGTHSTKILIGFVNHLVNFCGMAVTSIRHSIHRSLPLPLAEEIS
ncbi:hypothetical protein E2C01_047405 [Portunus trituberculatus]|uniref:Uncharacterized protein n=1 Tax=Portunus trituberculatus TaxID=210409 RepID=A0A5B7G110_PORTR|nr:hypothetical protein [Portunus trituberculatus]